MVAGLSWGFPPPGTAPTLPGCRWVKKRHLLILGTRRVRLAWKVFARLRVDERRTALNDELPRLTFVYVLPAAAAAADKEGETYDYK